MSKLSDVITKPLKSIRRKLSDWSYALKIKLFPPRKNTGGKEKSLSTQKRNDLIFYISCFSVPTIFFVLNRIIINGNSFILAFSEYNTNTGKTEFAAFRNFAAVLKDFTGRGELQNALVRSCRVYLILTVITNIVPVVFSYYIYKKMPGFKAFKIIMFLPSIISGIITVTIFKTITERMIPSVSEALFNKTIEGLLSNPNTTFNTILFYCVWLSFGSGLLIQLAAMNTVDESVTESAKLEGISFFKELWYIVLPASYQVLAIHFIAGFATLFTHDLGLFAFYGLGADSRVQTIGYHFTVQTRNAATPQYPYLAAWGLITSFIAIPVTLLLRHVVYKYGPSEE